MCKMLVEYGIVAPSGLCQERVEAVSVPRFVRSYSQESDAVQLERHERSACHRRRVLHGLAFACVCASTIAAGSAGEVKTAYSPVRSAFAAQLRDLAAWCDENGLDDEARQTRQWLSPRNPNRFYPIILQEEGGASRSTEDRDENATAWRTRFDRLRRKQADALFGLARRAAKQRERVLAYHLVLATVRENPDHEDARRALGYRHVEGRWLTRFEADKHKAKQLWHERFGWIAADRVARYERGERFYRGSWIGRRQEHRIRSHMTRGWRIPTEHFVVTTNHSLESGVQLAVRLERFYEVWRQMFVGYYATDRQVQQMIAGRPLGRHSPRRHQVMYYRDRQEYIDSLRGEQSNIDITTGIYLGDKRTAYFFAGEDEDHATQYHETAHQLFSESRPVVRDIGRKANFWIVEGIACYMESFGRHEGRYSVGGLDAQRVLAARYRLLDDNFYLPLAEFTGLGMDALQRHQRIRTLYSQATGWTHFLIHYQDGLYRDSVTDYLVAVYSGRDRAETLAQLTGTGYPELDRQYREFFQAAQ